MAQVSRASETASVDGLEAKFVDVAGIRTRYYEAGAGEALVLCHGSGWGGRHSANIWSRNIPGLGERFHVFAADKIGSGMTDNPKRDEDYTVQVQTQHMYDFIRAMGIERCHLVGQSRGAYTAARLALQYPGLAKTLTLVDTGTLAPRSADTSKRRAEIYESAPPEENAREWARHILSGFTLLDDTYSDEYVDAYLYMEHLPKSQALRKWWESGGEALFNKTLFAEKEETVRWMQEGRLTIPTLVVWGRNDRTALLDQGYGLFDMIAEHNRRTRLIVLAHAGHYNFREYPEEFNRSLINFCTLWEE